MAEHLQPTTTWVMTWREWSAVLGGALAAFMAILDIQITNASLREIQGSLGLDLLEGSWISTAYLIAEIVVIPITGVFSEVIGIRKFISINTVMFIVSSILCGLAWNLNSMIVFRVMQGFFGGTLIPMAFQMVLYYMPSNMRTIGMVIFGLTATLAPTLGPSFGGWLTDNYGWRTNFFINLGPGLIMLAMIRAGVPKGTMDLGRLKNFDWLGTFTMAIGLATLTYVLEDGSRVQWFEDESIQICSLVAFGSLTAFLLTQIVSENPLLKLRVLLDRNFSIAVVITTISGAALYGGIYSLSLFLGQLQNYSATDIGAVMMWIGLPQILVMPLLPLMMKYVDMRILAAIGIGLFSLSNFLNSGLDYNFAGEQLKFSLLVRAIGQPMFMIPLSIIAMNMVKPEHSADASSIFNMMRNMGGSIGIALAGTFMVSRQSLHQGHMMEQVHMNNTSIVERLYQFEMFLRSKGLDVTAAKTGALKFILGIVQRDSYILAFSDIFFTLGSGLLICVVLVLLTRKTQFKEGGLAE